MIHLMMKTITFQQHTPTTTFPHNGLIVVQAPLFPIDGLYELHPIVDGRPKHCVLLIVGDGRACC